MAMTLRLDDETQAALDAIVAEDGVTASAAIRAAILEYAARRRAVRDALIDRIVTEDRALLDRLG